MPVVEHLEWEEGGQPSGRINKIIAKESGSFFLIGGDRWSDGFMYRSIDNGKSWKTVNDVSDTSDFFLTDIHFDSFGNGMCVGFGGQIFFTQDGGSNWLFHRHIGWSRFESVWLSDHGLLNIAGDGSFQSGTMGVSTVENWWTYEFDSIPLKVFDIHQLFNGSYLAAGFGGVLLKDANASWRRMELEGDIFLQFSFPSETTGYLCGFNGSIYAFDVPNLSWKELEPPTPAFSKVKSWNTLHFFDEQNGVVAGDNGVIWKTNNAGQSWLKTTLPGKEDIYALYMLNRDTCMAGGRNGFLAKIIFK